MQGVDLGHIRLVAMDSLANRTIPRFLSRVSAAYPKVRIDVEITTRLAPINNKKLMGLYQSSGVFCNSLAPGSAECEKAHSTAGRSSRGFAGGLYTMASRT